MTHDHCGGVTCTLHSCTQIVCRTCSEGTRSFHHHCSTTILNKHLSTTGLIRATDSQLPGEECTQIQASMKTTPQMTPPSWHITWTRTNDISALCLCSVPTEHRIQARSWRSTSHRSHHHNLTQPSSTYLTQCCIHLKASDRDSNTPAASCSCFASSCPTWCCRCCCC